MTKHFLKFKSLCLDVGFTKTPPNFGKHNSSFTHLISAIGAGTSPRANSILAIALLVVVLVPTNVSFDRINKNSYILKKKNKSYYLCTYFGPKTLKLGGV